MKRIMILCAFLLFLSCVANNSNNRPIKGTDAVNAKIERSITIAGLGYAKTKDKGLAANWARNMAYGMLTQNSAGFTFNINKSGITIKSDAEAEFSGEEKVLQRIDSMEDASFATLVVLESKTKILQLKNQKETTLDFDFKTDTIDNLASNILKKELTVYQEEQDQVKEDISGKAYIIQLSLVYNNEEKIYQITGQCLILFSSKNMVK